MNSNINQLQPQPPSQVQRVSKDGQDKDANFLALRLLNKRARVRLSPNSIKLDSIPGRGVLFAVANSSGLFVAATCDAAGGNALIVSKLSELRAAFASSSSEDEILFNPRRTITLPNQVVALSFAAGDSRLVVAFTEGSTAVYNAQTLLDPDPNATSPLTVFQSPTGAAPRELASNPGDLPNLVAVLYEGNSAQGPVIQLFDVLGLQVFGGWTSNGTPATTPTSLSWSTKGKQLAIGLQSGDIMTFSPNDTSSVKTYIPAPTSIQSQSVIGLTWLSNSDFHCIYAPPGPLMPESDQKHIIISFDPKSKAETDVKLNTPYFTVPGTRPPGSFNAVLRHWDPTKFMVFAGDSTTSDIGMIGCTIEAGEEVWCNFSMEENSTPSLPLDKDMNDTILLGLALDLTKTESYDFTTVSGEDATMPPPPIMLAYVSDGTILGWNIVNVRGQQYPGMVPPASAADSEALMDTSITIEKPSIVVSTTPTAFQQSIFGQSSPFGQAALGQGSALGGTTSAFGSTGGFGAFASGSSKFGQTGFGTVTPTLAADNSSLASPMAISMSNSEDPMSADVETDAGFGGLSLGGASSSEADKSKAGTGGLFGAFATNEANKSSSAFDSSSSMGLVKPATGFGAFANQNPTSGQSPMQSSDSGPSVIKPASGFGAFASSGQSSFGAFSSGATAEGSKPSAFGGGGTPATAQVSSGFGQSGFGTKPAFGQSGFGQPSLRQSAFGQSGFGAAQTQSAFSSSPAASSGGFASFAKAGPTGFSAFAQPAGKEEKLDAVTSHTAEAEMSAPTGESSKPEVAPSTPGRKAPSVFGTPSTPTPSSQTSSTTPSASPSVFKSSSPGPTTGAFANLTAHPTGFGKLSTGFGAFGNAAPSSSSPFLNPPKVATTGGSGPVSAFAPIGSSTSAKPASAFGTSSLSTSATAKPTFGAASALGSSSTPTSPFGKMGSETAIKPATVTSGGFGAFSSSGGFSALSGGTKSFSELLKSDGGSTSTAPSSDKKPVSVFATLPTLPAKPSSETVTRASEWAADEGGSWDQDRGSDEDQDGPIDGENFLSDEFSEDDDDDEDEDDDGEGDETLKATEGEASTPTPIRLVSSPPPPTETKPSAESTTPPGSPLKEPPAAASNTPAAAAFSGGPSRPSTKPIRSSPLTNAPISGDEQEDDDDDLEEVVIPPASAAQKPTTPIPAASPAPVLKDATSGSATARPKTPPLLSTFATPAPKPPPFSLQPAKQPTATSVFGTSLTPSMPAASSSSTNASPSLGSPALTGGLFGRKSPTPSLFGSAAPATSTPIAAQPGLRPPSASPSPAIATPQPAASTTPGLLGPTPSLPTTPPAVPISGAPATQPAATPAADTAKLSVTEYIAQLPEGMTKECAKLAALVSSELNATHLLSLQARKRRLELYKPSTVSGTQDDLLDPKKFQLHDVAEFGRLLLTLEKDLAVLKDSRAAQLKSVAELENAMLRATMRKEEIVRFSKASTDAEFSKMLKARTLSPDHLETQLQLRRSIRVISDRIQKLEDHLHAAKKRLTEMKTGKPGIRPPSLDTLNRTYRNIEVAVSQQAEHVSRLSSRVAKLDIHGVRSSARSNTSERSPEEATSSQRTVQVTPNVAAATAAALNAERAAQRLKAALLRVRKQPLYNTQALHAPPPPSAFAEPPAIKTKQEWTPPPSSFFQSQASASTSSVAAWNLASPPPSKPMGEPATPAWSLPPFQLPETPESPETPSRSHNREGTGPSPSLRQRGGGATKMHQKPVPLKKSPNTQVPPPPSNFSWGPLPGVGPMVNLSANVTRKEEKTEAESSLSDSWVADGFGKK